MEQTNQTGPGGAKRVYFTLVHDLKDNFRILQPRPYFPIFIGDNNFLLFLSLTCSDCYNNCLKTIWKRHYKEMYLFLYLSLFVVVSNKV